MSLETVDDIGMLALREGTIWKHVKTGGVYVIVGHCMIEATNTAAVLYQSTSGKKPVWCRPFREFTDGRFIPQETA